MSISRDAGEHSVTYRPQCLEQALYLQGYWDLDFISLGLGGRKLELDGAGNVELGPRPKASNSQSAVHYNDGCDEPGPYSVKTSEEGRARKITQKWQYSGLDQKLHHGAQGPEAKGMKHQIAYTPG